ncbi:MAG: hypothetical protein IT307_19860, partial [Chloroflexi bacterium]|nr:hypothetical protein [Chloroflexota bacterium]
VRGSTAFTGGLGDSLYSRVRRYDAGFVLRDDGTPPADPEQARVRARIFELAQQYQYPREVRRDLQEEFPLTDAQTDRALRDAALVVIRQDIGHYIRGTVDMSLDLLKGRDLSLVELWQIRQSARVVQGWPDHLRFALGEPDRWPVASAATVRPLVNLVKDDQTPSRYLVALLPLGMLASLAPARRRAGMVITLVVLSQTLLYVALDGPLFRYRYPLQPLITLLCVAGGELLLRQIRVLLSWRTCDRRSPGARLE